MPEDRAMVLRCYECHGTSFTIYGKDHWRCTACLCEKAEFVVVGYMGEQGIERA
jgi:hypothetical protein